MWAIFSEFGGPIYVSEDIKGDWARRLLGYCITKNWLRAPKELIDYQLPSDKWKFFALLQDRNGEVTKMDLSEKWAGAKAQFDGLFGPRPQDWKYTDGIIGHASGRRVWALAQSKSLEITSSHLYRMNVYALPVKFSQLKLGKWNEAHSSIEDMGLETKKMVEDRAKEQLEKVTKLWNGFPGENMKYGYMFSNVLYRPRDAMLSSGPSSHNLNARTSIRYVANWVWSSYIRNQPKENKIEFMIISREHGVIYSSIEDLTNDVNRLMLGWALER